ncbi:i[[h]] channel isoform e [Holotrichia oblita]|uniref:I[[h]] channel isoform e n=1 Tax=Holotrichia oblita TaxID=644536 RepID=A0ACB9SIH2_HOLOL|nr:i[[h]] channel isoform e [Holotrichia oblita]
MVKLPKIVHILDGTFDCICITDICLTFITGYAIDHTKEVVLNRRNITTEAAQGHEHLHLHEPDQMRADIERSAASVSRQHRPVPTTGSVPTERHHHKSGHDGRLHVCHLQDGGYFGEMSLIAKDSKRIANVVAIETTEVYRLERKHFNGYLKTLPELYKKLERVAERRRENTLVMEEIHRKHILEKTMRMIDDR